ncbi:MAG: peptidylprolyl isomerase [Gemmatimonadota bacterium]
MTKSMRIFAPVILGFALASPLAAQASGPPETLVDRIVAVVGDSVVLASNVEEQLLRLEASGQKLPTDSAAMNKLRRQTLEPIINQLLLVQAAVQDSVVVDDADVNSEVDAELRRRQQAVGGPAALQAALARSGLTQVQFRDMLRKDISENMLVQRYLAQVQRDRNPPPVTLEEMRQFLDSRRASLGKRPATISFAQVVVSPQPTDSARQAALAKARDILAQLQHGADFAELARHYSQDPGSAQQGGELGWFRPGQMVPAFEQAAYALRPGQISGIVETPFGFHIIKMERARGPEREARQILIKPEITQADMDSAKVRAQEVSALAQQGVSMDSLQARFGDPNEEERVGPTLQESLPEPYRAVGRGEGHADAGLGRILPRRRAGARAGPQAAPAAEAGGRAAQGAAREDVHRHPILKEATPGDTGDAHGAAGRDTRRPTGHRPRGRRGSRAPHGCRGAGNTPARVRWTAPLGAPRRPRRGARSHVRPAGPGGSRPRRRQGHS